MAQCEGVAKGFAKGFAKGLTCGAKGLKGFFKSYAHKKKYKNSEPRTYTYGELGKRNPFDPFEPQVRPFANPFANPFATPSQRLRTTGGA